MQYKVYPALRSVILRFYIETHQFENDEEHILIVQLQFFHQFVGSIGKETLQAAEESIGLSSLYFLYKLLYFKRCFNLVETCYSKGMRNLTKPSSTSRLGKPRR